MRNSIRFIHRGVVVEPEDFAPYATVLDFLRLRVGNMGSKEGCAEGDCGACTVAVGEIREGALRFEPVNACIHLLGMLDAKVLLTVDDLASENDVLHPVQSAMATAHASQCGFCTPGFVMSLYALYTRDTAADRSTINDWLAGNLCRCMGYRPIVDAALEVLSASHKINRTYPTRLCLLHDLQNEDDSIPQVTKKSFLRRRLQPNPCPYYTKNTPTQRWSLVQPMWVCGLQNNSGIYPKLFILAATELKRLVEADAELEIGASVTCTHAETALGHIDPDIAEIMRRYGSKQVRACATIGGNIANGSPIGDSPPMLIVLGARLTLQRGNNTRTIALEDFFIDYGQQDLAPGEFVKSVTIPHLEHNQSFRAYKISKRFDQDISALLGAFRFTIENNVIVAARIAFGGMAPTPRRASTLEQSITGLSLADEKRWPPAIDALEQDFKPIGDMRASAEYRMQTAKALALKALTEVAGKESTQTRVRGHREDKFESAA
ncbi:MAG: xanthine dehydrogenase small subunit [Arenicellales bacterium WSBS_2016_MAG_OTU3]